MATDRAIRFSERNLPVIQTEVGGNVNLGAYSVLAADWGPCYLVITKRGDRTLMTEAQFFDKLKFVGREKRSTFTEVEAKYTRVIEAKET